ATALMHRSAAGQIRPSESGEWTLLDLFPKLRAESNT
ncbi:hypothetical protein Tco_0547464, partial [Tanacetum coccineum]